MEKERPEAMALPQLESLAAREPGVCSRCLLFPRMHPRQSSPLLHAEGPVVSLLGFQNKGYWEGTHLSASSTTLKEYPGQIWQG